MMAVIQGFFRVFLPVYWISWKTSIVPFSAFGNARTNEERDQLVNVWKGAMLSQLSNVKLIGAIFLAVIVGASTSPIILNLSPGALVFLEALWFSSLIFSIAAVAVAVHQSVFLARLSSIPNYQAALVEIVCYETEDGRREPRREQAIIWLLAVALLEWSMGFWIGGYAVFIWDVTRMGQKDQGLANIVVASVCGLTLVISVALYALSVQKLWGRAFQSKALLKIE